MRLLSPDTQASRSVLADWLELQALNFGRAGRPMLDSIFRFTSEERSVRLSRDPSSFERDDGEIIEVELDGLISDVLQELEWRQEKLGSDYPFRLNKKNAGLISNWELLGPSRPFTVQHTVYSACVIIVAFRRNLLEPGGNMAHLFSNHRIGLIFQICACIALGGYIQGEVVSFGWPRETGDSFLLALQNAWKRFGAYEIVADTPEGAPHALKDGGIDIIAWRTFADRRPSRLLIFGQVASGDNWIDKSANGPAKTLVGYWFVGARPGHWLPATLMPFVAHEEDGLDSLKSVPSSIFDRMQYYELDHGIVFDRIRIVECVASAVAIIAEGRTVIDGFDRLFEVSEWVNGALTLDGDVSEAAVR